MSFLKTDEFEELILILPHPIRSRVVACVLTFTLMTTFENILMHAIKHDSDNTCNTKNSNRNAMTEVTRLVGWSVYSRETVLIDVMKREDINNQRLKVMMKLEKWN